MHWVLLIFSSNGLRYEIYYLLISLINLKEFITYLLSQTPSENMLK